MEINVVKILKSCVFMGYGIAANFRIKLMSPIVRAKHRVRERLLNQSSLRQMHVRMDDSSSSLFYLGGL